MKIFQYLRKIVALLEEDLTSGRWALCGGVAASIYRDTPRFTGDIDIAIIDHPPLSAIELTTKALTSMGYQAIPGWITDQHGHIISAQALVIGRETQEGPMSEIDFLLPVLPWVNKAVHRAQSNKLDYGFALVPTIPPEDLIIAKLYALEGSPSRPYDRDDITAILRNIRTIDKAYLLQELKNLGISCSPEIEKLIS